MSVPESPTKHLWWPVFLLHAFTGCGVFVGLLGVAYYAKIHTIAYFIVVQVFVGIVEVSSVIALHDNTMYVKNCTVNRFGTS